MKWRTQALTDIALEARFSDHGVTEAQLEQMRAFLSHERKRLSESLPCSGVKARLAGSMRGRRGAPDGPSGRFLPDNREETVNF